MKIATCLNDDGGGGNPFTASTVRVFEGGGGTWVEVQKLEYRPAREMGVDEARLLLRRFATQLKGCEVFLLPELRGYAHAWLAESGFRAWKSEGSLADQLDRVAELEALGGSSRPDENPRRGATVRGTGGMGCGGGCGASISGDPPKCASGKCPSGTGSFPEGGAEGLSCGSVPEPMAVGDPSDRRYRFDLAAALAADPTLTSRAALVPFLENEPFSVLELSFDHVPRWFEETLRRLKLVADFDPSVPGSACLFARIRPAEGVSPR